MTTALATLQTQYDRAISEAARKAAVAADLAEVYRVRTLSAADEARETVTRRHAKLREDRQTVMHFLAKRREARAAIAFRLDAVGKMFARSDFAQAEEDARFHLRWYVASKQLLAQAKAELADALAAQRNAA